MLEKTNFKHAPWYIVNTESKKEAHIALKSQSDKIDLTDELASCLRKINLRTFGLAFVKVR